MFFIGFFKRKDEEKVPTPRQSPADEDRPRVAYDIGDDAIVRSRNARIRNHDTAFKVRNNGQLDDKNSDIA